MKFVPSIITVYLSGSDEILEPESIHQAPSIPETLSIRKFVWHINCREDCIIEFFKTAVDYEAFHTQWYNKASDVGFGHEKSNKSNNECLTSGERYTEDGVNGYNVPFANNGFTKHVFTFKSNF